MTMTDKPKRSSVGIELVRRLSTEGHRIFTMDQAREVAPQVGISEAYLAEALHHLSRTGWIVRLRRGLYALSSSVPGMTPAHEFEIAMALVSPSAISHWSALHFHGLTEQAPRQVFVLTTTGSSLPRSRRQKARNGGTGYLVGDTTFQFVQTRPERYFGIEKAWIGETRVAITDPERTLIDGLTMPQYCGDLAQVLHAFAVRRDDLELERIVDYALRLDSATAKRLGWVLDQEGVSLTKLERLLDLPIKGYRKLDPTGPRAGPHNRRWMIQENLPGRIGA